MIRISKQSERRHRFPRRPKANFPKTGAKKDNLEVGFRPHANATQGDLAKKVFIPKM